MIVKRDRYLKQSQGTVSINLYKGCIMVNIICHYFTFQVRIM